MFKFKLRWLLRGYIFMVNPKPSRFQQKPELPWCPRGPCSTAISTFLCWDEWQNSWDIKQYILTISYCIGFNIFNLIQPILDIQVSWCTQNHDQKMGGKKRWTNLGQLEVSYWLYGLHVYHIVDWRRPSRNMGLLFGSFKGLRILRNSGLVAGDVEDVFRGSKFLVPGHHLGRFGTSNPSVPASIPAASAEAKACRRVSLWPSIPSDPVGFTVG